MLVDLDVLVAPGDEERVDEMIRSSVARAVATGALQESGWHEASVDDDDLVRQWEIEHHGPPPGERRVRRFTMGVEAEGVAGLVEEIAWAAIDAIYPDAREEERRVDAGERVVPTPDELPWCNATRVTSAHRLLRPPR